MVAVAAAKPSVAMNCRLLLVAYTYTALPNVTFHCGKASRSLAGTSVGSNSVRRILGEKCVLLTVNILAVVERLLNRGGGCTSGHLGGPSMGGLNEHVGQQPRLGLKGYRGVMDPPDRIDHSSGLSAPPHRRPRPGGRAPRDVTEIRLRDGSRIWVRPIRPEDRDRMVEGLSRLSARSRYLRFHSAVNQLTSAQLDYLTDVDHDDHEALVAIDPDISGHPGVAVARYIRLPEEPTIAEAAITVVDDYQGRGIGTAMIGLLEGLAHRRGIRTFRNYVLAENKPMLAIFRQLDGELVSEGAGLYRVDVPVPGLDDQQPDTPAGRWVASIARNSDRRADAWAYPLLWFLRKVTRGAPDDEGGSQSRLLKNWARSR